MPYLVLGDFKMNLLWFLKQMKVYFFVKKMSDCLFFVCSKCHSLCCFDVNEEESDSGAARKFAGQIQIKVENIVALRIRSKIFKNFQKKPLCASCIDKELNKLQIQNQIIQNFEETLNEVDITKVENVAKLFTGSEISKDSLDRNSNQLSNGTNKIEITQNPEEFLLQIPSQSSKKASPIRTGKSFAAHICYDISFIGQYGTINTLRVGSLKSNPVPQQEVQNGLYLICRYLKLLLQSNNISSDDFIINQKIVFLIDKKPVELLYQEKKFIVTEFNTAVDKMMWYFEQLFDVLSKKAISPPNRIETSKKQINGRSYLYTPSDPFDFVLAMKRLLINLKAFQVLQTFT